MIFNTNKINFFSNRTGLNIIFILICMFVFFYTDTIYFHNYSGNLFERGDWPSYYYFFEYSKSIDDILGNHRTIVGPIIVEIYKNFDEELLYWSYFNYALFIFSLIYLLNVLLDFKYNSVFTIVFVCSLIGSYHLQHYLNTPTIFLSIISKNLTLVFFLKAFHKNLLKYELIFMITFFLSVLIRPTNLFLNFFFFIFVLVYSFQIKKLIYFQVLSLGPVIFYLLIKFFITGYFSLVPLNGILKTANALQYIEMSNSSSLSENQKILKENLIIEKKKLAEPCDNYLPLEFKAFPVERKKLSVWNKNYSNLLYCYGDWVALSWIEASKIFEREKYENFKYQLNKKNLSFFFTSLGNTEIINYELNKFTKNIAFDPIFAKISFAYKNFIQTFKEIKIAARKTIYLAFILPIVIFLINLPKINFLINHKIEFKDKVLIYSMLIYSLIHIIIIQFLNIPILRIISNDLIYLIPGTAVFMVMLSINLSNYLKK